MAQRELWRKFLSLSELKNYFNSVRNHTFAAGSVEWPGSNAVIGKGVHPTFLIQ